MLIAIFKGSHLSVELIPKVFSDIYKPNFYFAVNTPYSIKGLVR